LNKNSSNDNSHLKYKNSNTTTRSIDIPNQTDLINRNINTDLIPVDQITNNNPNDINLLHSKNSELQQTNIIPEPVNLTNETKLKVNTINTNINEELTPDMINKDIDNEIDPNNPVTKNLTKEATIINNPINEDLIEKSKSFDIKIDQNISKNMTNQKDVISSMVKPENNSISKIKPEITDMVETSSETPSTVLIPYKPVKFKFRKRFNEPIRKKSLKLNINRLNLMSDIVPIVKK